MSTLFLPLVITSWMLGGGIGLIVDTTVGEKERQTIENLLVTPASRAGIVMGKMSVVFIASLAVLGLWLTEGLLLNALGAAAPTLSELESPGLGQIITVLLQSSGDVVGLVLALLALVVPFTVLLNSLVIAWCTYAANYREANLFMILLQLALPSSVLLTVFSLPARVGLYVYAIPFFGSIVAIRDLFGSTLSPLGLAVNLVSGIIYAALSVWLAAWVFDQEWSLTRGI
jgi:sodium transport system permease protein